MAENMDGRKSQYQLNKERMEREAAAQAGDAPSTFQYRPNKGGPPRDMPLNVEEGSMAHAIEKTVNSDAQDIMDQRRAAQKRLGR